jgi:hypothetical protein
VTAITAVVSRRHHIGSHPMYRSFFPANRGRITMRDALAALVDLFYLSSLRGGNLMRSVPRCDRLIMALAISASISLMLLCATLELVGF